ncbi:cyclopropane-fatty-acyl-phospholipid synthase [Phakopsora pachyrhizi]|uniref:sphingolipid C(9)-methyltransferase n=1 Tax=Phakopsora pachyrhizi TaxID=170000 RepID=A0AAV0B153_PHAPC|nr:cyclopropane-fatty-acyl-phospholipid synthase [Phakopsora pachyrhizi]KAI8452269.1 cyclopropane-fatty-acyl-phospholipid synthase [Phakopsora pachyrhizi]CAH7675699.1 cyclopropane-fatty-acyl-phospholipid synthase [Phakopsora pachyrhizi]
MNENLKKNRTSVKLTSYPSIKNSPFPPVEGNGRFSNIELALAVTVVPYLIGKISLPFITVGFLSYAHIFLVIILGAPVAVLYWSINSYYWSASNQSERLPGKPQSSYFIIKDPLLNKKYGEEQAKNGKIPMQVWHDAFFDGKIELKGDMLDILEYRHDWASFHLTPTLFKYVITRLIPEVILHTTSQDEEQVRDHYDRGDDFYRWFLGPRMVYTSGIVSDPEREESLEDLQDNKLKLVCQKLDLKPDDHLLDIGCGWGTLAAFAAKNYGCKVTGVTLGRNQAKFGNERIAANGIPSSQAKILCQDFRDTPAEPKGRFSKIVTLEMAEHVGIRRYPDFLKQVYDLLADDGTLVFQVAGIRTNWQYEDLIWGLFMNKYIFPGADASLNLGWVITKLEQAGFEVRAIDVLGVHYSATIWRWYKNWQSNAEKVKEKYGERWYRIWEFFLAYSTITPRQGSVSVFQITLHKNINSFDRIGGSKSHTSLSPIQKRKLRSDPDYKELVCQPVNNE